MSCSIHRRRRADCPACQASPDVVGGQFYGVTEAGEHIRVGPALGDVAPDVWICRRVADYPGGRVPAGGQVAPCARCAAPIVFNPARTVAAPKHCMQCERLAPLPVGD